MTAPPATAELVDTAEAEIDLVPEVAAMHEVRPQLDDTDGVFDLTDRRRVFLAVLFGLDVPPTAADEVFTSSAAPDGESS